MPTQVNIHQAKTQLSRLLEQVEAGESIVIAKAGKPKALLTAIPSTQPRSPGRFAGKISYSDDAFSPLSEEILDAIEQGHAEDPLRMP